MISILHNKKPIRIAILLLFATCAIPICAQKMVPNAPIIDFKLPLFGTNGYKTWEIQGAEGRYINPEKITVLILTIRTFSGDESLALESIISSPDAIIDTKKKQANGSSYINIYGQGFRIHGKDWTWNGMKKSIIIRQNTQVDFDHSLGIRLR